jgi:hypothetical protein
MSLSCTTYIACTTSAHPVLQTHYCSPPFGPPRTYGGTEGGKASTAATAAHAIAGSGRSPFTIPRDEDIFDMLQQRAADKAAARAASEAARVEVKSTFASRQQALFHDGATKQAFLSTMRPAAQVCAESICDDQSHFTVQR